MAVENGTRLGPYEILSPIGSGGMGEVYKARDTRLNRIVAVKVLPATLAADPEFKGRFEREAKTISSLNHPNICTLYDVGETASDSAASVAFLVMEYLDGETLADRIKKGPVPVAQAIEIASQIADALDKAHRSGIVHRDLKPANVFLVRAAGASGTPHCKLLDFGLAKMGGAATLGSLETRLETTPKPGEALTAHGTILGTFQYMAPEQVEGQEADARTDIWAFGCVLYEMLSGKRAFEGKSQAGLLASILERQPAPVTELQPLVPPALGRLVRTCLEKDPNNRFHTAHDLWLHLEWIEEGGSAGSLAPAVAGREQRSPVWYGVSALVLAAIAAAASWWLKPVPVPPNVVTRFSFPLADGLAFSRPGRRDVAISQDGTKIAFIANSQIYLRPMKALEAQVIRGTAGIDPLELAFSPDGQWIAFITPNTPQGSIEDTLLRKVSVEGGAPVTLCKAGQPYGLRWQGDRVVYSLGDRILSVPDTSGKPEVLATAANANETLAQPSLLGDRHSLLYTVRAGKTFNEGQIVVQPIGGGPRRLLVDGGTDALVLPTGHLIWIRDDILYAQAIDPRTLQLAGGPVPVIEGIREAPNVGVGQFTVAENGTIVFAPGSSDVKRVFVWVDRSGHEEPTGSPTQSFTYPRISPDGTSLATGTTDGDQDIWVWNFARKTMTRLTSGPDVDQYPVWTPDSRWVIFRSSPQSGRADVYRRAADGTGTLERLTDSPEMKTPQMVLADGKRVLLRTSVSNSTPYGPIQLLPLAPGASPTPVFSHEQAVTAEVSPDGRWILYQSPEGSTRDEIHVRPFPDTEAGHWQISSGGGQRPTWARSGREIFFDDTRVGFPAGSLERVEVGPSSGAGSFTYGTPTPMFSLAPYYRGGVGRAWDISPDDKRFLMIKPIAADAGARDSITVITHWFDELKGRVKAK